LGSPKPVVQHAHDVEADVEADEIRQASGHDVTSMTTIPNRRRDYGTASLANTRLLDC
jgi:hypothetical protein